VSPTMAFTIVEFERDNVANVYFQMEGMLPFVCVEMVSVEDILLDTARAYEIVQWTLPLKT
jgi:hypothetical protein